MKNVCEDCNLQTASTDTDCHHDVEKSDAAAAAAAAAAASDSDTEDSTFICDVEDSENSEADTNQPRFVPRKKRGRPPLVDRNAKVVKAAERYRRKLKNSNFLICVTRTNVNLGIMHFPAEFMKKSTSDGECQYTELCISNKSWKVRVTTYHGRKEYVYHKLGHGFGKFVDDNGINVGDVCVFEAAPAHYKAINVTVFRCSNAK